MAQPVIGAPMVGNNTTTDQTQPPFTPKATDIIELQVRDQRFRILTASLTQGSQLYRAIFECGAMGVINRTIDGAYIIQADPAVFKHIYDYLENSTFPSLWDKADGFDWQMYARILQTADYLQIRDLVEWIKAKKYERVICQMVTTRCYRAEDMLSSREAFSEKQIRSGNETIERQAFSEIDDA